MRRWHGCLVVLTVMLGGCGSATRLFASRTSVAAAPAPPASCSPYPFDQRTCLSMIIQTGCRIRSVKERLGGRGTISVEVRGPCPTGPATGSPNPVGPSPPLPRPRSVPRGPRRPAVVTTPMTPTTPPNPNDPALIAPSDSRSLMRGTHFARALAILRRHLGPGVRARMLTIQPGWAELIFDAGGRVQNDGVSRLGRASNRLAGRFERSSPVPRGRAARCDRGNPPGITISG